MGKGSNVNTNTQAPRPGKGKLTPIQIAYLVDRYLLDNNYTKTLSTFRSEASPLFSKAKGKGVPKGLLALQDILDEYIVLKGQKVGVDLEKMKADMLVQRIQDCLHLYRSGSDLQNRCISPPLPPNLPHPTNPTNAISPTGNNRIVTQSMSSASVRKSVVSLIPEPESSNGTSGGKRKVSTSDSLPKPALKKSSRADLTIRGIQLPSQVSYTNTNTTSIATTEVSTKINSCQKKLFKQPPETPLKLSSPNTPPQELPSYQPEKSMSSMESSHQEAQRTNANNIPSTCSVTSSKQVIVISPYKKAGYYSVERRHHQMASSSPMKSSPSKLGKREHVKSRLDFDCSELLPPTNTTTSTENLSIEKSEHDDIFDDNDFLQICGDFSFSEFLDFDLDDLSCPPSSSSSTDLTHWSNYETGNGFEQTNQDQINIQTINGSLSSESSIKTVTTKCIAIMSPVKNHMR